MNNMGATSTKTAHVSGLKILLVMLIALCLPGMWNSLSLAQSHPITFSGLNTQVSEPTSLTNGQTNYDITGGTRPGGATGTNLFHNFGDFNVPTKNIANFLNAGSVDLAGNPLAAGLPTTNILGAVTGVNPSIIFGTIQTNGTGGFGDANLFLMNPNGIIFGPTASLNVGGMATFTTANYLRLTDTGIFHADPAATSLLTSASIAAFGFLGSNPAAISVQGSTLAVQPGQSISLVGGNQGFTYANPDTGSTAVPNGVTVTGGHLSAREHLQGPGIQVNMVSVASPGEVTAGTLEYAPNVNGQSFGALGTIEVSKKSNIDVSGNGGGTVLIRGGLFVLDNSTITANVKDSGPVTNGVESIGGGIDIVVSQDAVIKNLAVIETNLTGNATPGVQYGGVHVEADHIKILGVLPNDDPDAPLPFTGIRSNVVSGSTGGHSGNIKLEESNTILVKDFGQLETVTEGTGNAGNIIVTANHNIEIASGGQINSGSQGASGSGGNVELTSKNGDIIMTTNDPNFPTLVTTQSNVSSGDPGNIVVRAEHGDIILSGSGGQLFVNVGTIAGAGGKGQIQLKANNLQLNDGMTVSQVNASPVPVGDVTVDLAGNLSLHGQSKLFTTARALAPAANLNITAHEILVTEGSSISTGTTSSGPGGHLNISANSLALMNGGQITSGSTIARLPGGRRSSPTGPGGTITIQGNAGSADSVRIDGVGSGISTSTEGTGAGGTINLSARSLTMSNDATITASSTGTVPNPGNAGDISINAGQRLEMRASSITTQATQASGGNINIQAVDHIRLVNSVVSSSVADGPGGGGNISIDPQVVALQDSKILAQAADGQGGAIKIITSLFLRDANSKVNADAGSSGLNGTVTIQSPTSNLSESLGTLPSEPSQTHSLLTQRCAALVNGQTSSFVVAGRQQLPADPGGWLTSPLAFAALGGSLDAGHTDRKSVV